MQIMARLCKQMNPLLTDTVLNSLNKRNIFTTIDFLDENSEKLIHITKLPYKDILHLRHSIIANFSAFATSGKYAYSDTVANSALIPTQIESLDELLCGGFLTGSTYEICGPSACGKTQLCLTVAMNISHVLKQQVYYIDAKTDFSSYRILTMMEKRDLTEQDITAALERIQVVQVKSIFEIFSFFQSLKQNLMQREHEKFFMRLVILDSLPAIFYPCMSQHSTESMALIHCLASTMKYLALEFHLAFLLVSLAYSKQADEENADCDLVSSFYVHSETLKPAFGKHWSHVPSTRLLLNKVSSELFVTVQKSNCLKIGDSCTLRISDKGVE